jgi:glycine cleavage system P protein (glycine dehydrogenase) subunit 1
MNFISNSAHQLREMLKAIGVDSVDDLFTAIPDQLRLPAPEMDDGLSEFEGLQALEKIGRSNRYNDFVSYLGGGAYEHHIPAIVPFICQKSGFLTSYTPYQAECSQGTLQVIFEFQSAVCVLTGLDVSNASLYDGATACSEALLMALRLQKGRTRLLVANSVHPHYRAVAAQQLLSRGYEIVSIPVGQNGCIDPQAAQELLDERTAALLIQSPNYYGAFEEFSAIAKKAKQVGALSILAANPLSYGLFASAQEQSADIAIGEMQPFGISLSFGGPYCGYIACRESLMRQLPGRIVGETVDAKGRPGFVLTLQAREQHIRREKATSNICTSQQLCALAALVTILWYGKVGVEKLALTNFQRATYLKERLGKLPGVDLVTSGTTFNEFLVRFDAPIEQLVGRFRSCGILPGIPLSDRDLLVAVTETKSKEQLDTYLEVARENNL